MDLRDSLLYGVIEPAFKYGFRATKEPEWVHFRPRFEQHPNKKRREALRVQMENWLLRKALHESVRTLVHPDSPGRNIVVSVSDDGEIHCALRSRCVRKGRRSAIIPSNKRFRVDTWISVHDPAQAIAFVRKHAKRISRRIHGKKEDARPVRA